MRIAVSAQAMQVEYIAVTPAAAAGQPPSVQSFETFTVDLQGHTVK